MNSGHVIRAVAWCLAAFPMLALGQAPDRPSSPPEMRAHRLDAAPIIDGDVLDDPAWSDAIPATDFWQVRPDDGAPATQRTQVYVGFTDSALVIGVVAFDDDPGGIIVTDSRRDSHLGDTDAFLVLIDGLLDRQNGFIFGTNAAGIEYDGQVISEGAGSNFGFGSGGFNLNWDGSWTVQSKISELGWSAEFEIPFRTLRFGPDEIQDWGINFQRNIRRNNEVAFWAPLGLNYDLTRVSDAGTLRGVEPPAQRNLQITPYVLGKARRGGGLDGTEEDSEFGFDIKYSVTPSLTLDLTYNTDFAQVEVDEVQINLDRFNLFFPEKRPFFLENAGLFSVGVSGQAQLFHSRQIGISEDGDVIPVEGGARLSGRVGSRTNVGVLYMSTEDVEGIAPQNRFAVARVSQELPNRSGIGAIYTHRDGDGSLDADGDGSPDIPKSDDYNRAWAVDGRWGIGDEITLDAWYARSDTPGRTGDDSAFNVQGVYSSPTWESSLRYTEVGEDFNPEIGFLSRTDYRNVRAFLLRRIRPDDLWGLLELRPHISYTGFWKSDGFHETGFLHVDNHWEFKTGTEFHTGVNFTKSGVIEEFEIADGVMVPPGTYDHSEIQLVFFTDESRPFSFGINSNIGGRFGGDRVFLQPSIAFRIGETFRSRLSYAYNDFDLPGGSFKANLGRLRLSYSFTPKILLQAFVQYNELDDTLSTNLRFSWLRTANSGLYLVYKEFDDRNAGAPPTGREFILKYSHIFDVFD